MDRAPIRMRLSRVLKKMRSGDVATCVGEATAIWSFRLSWTQLESWCRI
jgi:hypothetical protein